ncbi:AsmA family protein [Vibrio sp. 10N]|uniref:AsmA family protein n=1 Tax=Vibrio sp. 10N TaxID=3058938 RepID=UPI0028142C9D|nr:AsmA family protein [Vibrio sp. 10N]
MIRKIVALLVALMALGLLSLLLVFAALHTQYAKPLVSYTLEKVFNIGVTSESIHYRYPNQLSFENARFEIADHTPIEVAKLSVWLSGALSTDQPITVHELLIDGTTITGKGTLLIALIQRWQIQNLALDHVDYSDNELIINDLRLQLKDLKLGDSFMASRGEIQLQASQLNYQGSALHDVLLDGILAGEQSKIYGASLTWNGANLSTQAQAHNGAWSLVNTTINRLTIETAHIEDPWFTLFRDNISHINSLDILNSSLQYKGSRIDNISASLESIELDKPFWSQQQAYLSIDADQVTWQGFEFIEPTIEVYATPNKLHIADLDAQLEQGRVQISGEFSPQEIKLDSVNIDGLKFIQEQGDASLLTLFRGINIDDIKSVSIKNVTFNRSQWIQLASKPFWQVTGFNMEASDLILKKDYQWGLWQGKATASANSASIDNVLANQIIMETESKQGKWQLSRLFVPFEQGYLSAKAELDFTAPSQPFTLSANAFSLPLQLSQYLNYPAPLLFTGAADVNLEINALIADKRALSQTLSGALTASFYNAAVTTAQSQPPLAVDITPLKMSGDRGRIELMPFSITAEHLNGEAQQTIDLSSQPVETLSIELTEPCKHSYNLQLLTGKITSTPIASCP